MAQGDQVGGFFCGLDARHPRHRQYVTFLVTALLQQRQGLRLHAYHRRRHGDPPGGSLVTDIHHPGGAGFVDVRESGHLQLR